MTRTGFRVATALRIGWTKWQPARLVDGTVSDGKTDTYDRCVEALLGNPETLMTSVFSAQNRKPLSAYANGEIKALRVELLGLEQIRETGAKANEVVRLLKQPGFQLANGQNEPNPKTPPDLKA